MVQRACHEPLLYNHHIWCRGRFTSHFNITITYGAEGVTSHFNITITYGAEGVTSHFNITITYGAEGVSRATSI
jgi:hypothetical protein